MYISRLDGEPLLAQVGAQIAAETILEAIAERGCANVALQADPEFFGMFTLLAECPNIDWSKLTLFPVTENRDAKRSRDVLHERFLRHIPGLKQDRFPGRLHEIQLDSDSLAEELRRLEEILSEHEIDLLCPSVGADGTLAGNKPEADFASESSYLLIRERKNDSGTDFNERITLSPQGILRAKTVLVLASGAEKAKAVNDTVYGDPSPRVPASILREHDKCTLLLDYRAAAQLDRIA